MRRGFFSGHRDTLRAISRGLIFIGLCLLLGVVAFFIAMPLRGGAARFGATGVIDSLSELFVFLAAHVVMLRWLHRKDWSWVWMDRSAARISKLILGLALGALTLVVPVTVLLIAGQLSIIDAPDGPWWAAAWLSFAILLPAAFAEELFARGYLFALLREAAGWKWALAVTSLAFGLLHMWNPEASWQSVTLVELAGVFLGAIVLVTGSLYAATIAHFVWNWIMAAVLHVPVSGHAVTKFPDYRIVETGPDWLTGGMWGPEGGIATGFGVALGVIYLFRRRSKEPSPVIDHV